MGTGSYENSTTATTMLFNCFSTWICLTFAILHFSQRQLIKRHEGFDDFSKKFLIVINTKLWRDIYYGLLTLSSVFSIIMMIMFIFTVYYNTGLAVILTIQIMLEALQFPLFLAALFADNIKTLPCIHTVAQHFIFITLAIIVIGIAIIIIPIVSADYTDVLACTYTIYELVVVVLVMMLILASIVMGYLQRMSLFQLIQQLVIVVLIIGFEIAKLCVHNIQSAIEYFSMPELFDIFITIVLALLALTFINVRQLTYMCATACCSKKFKDTAVVPNDNDERATLNKDYTSGQNM